MTKPIDAFVVKATPGEQEKFSTGAVRGNQKGKTRYDLLGLHALKREADHLAKGAELYGERNWQKGQDVSRTSASMLRHVFDYLSGDRSEDHIAAIRFNAGSIAHVEEEVKLGKLPATLLDLPFYADLPEFHETALTTTETIVLDFIKGQQAQSDYVEWVHWTWMKSKTLPSVPDQQFADVLLRLLDKGLVVAKVLDNNVRPVYALPEAVATMDEYDEDEYESL